VALEMGDLGGRPLLVRIHSQCLTGDVFHSLRCDCRAQLELSLAAIAEEGRGLLIYEHRKGAGSGLLNKLRAYQLPGWRRGYGRGQRIAPVSRPITAATSCRSRSCAISACQCAAAIQQPRFTRDRGLERAGIQVAEARALHCRAFGHLREIYLRTKKRKDGAPAGRVVGA